MMEAFETSFVRRGDVLELETNSKDPSAIKTCSVADFFLDSRDIQPNDEFISPGIIVRQESGEICGYATDDTIMFKHNALHRLYHLVLQNSKLYALDAIGTAYVFSAGESEAQTYDLGRRPIGWCPIPRTDLFVYWTQISFHVFDPEKTEHKSLRGHHSKITAVVSSVSTVVSGDSMGYLCIWYVSNFICHHTISTGHEYIHELILSKNSVFALTEHSLKEYNIQTGTLSRSVPVRANRMISLESGLLLSDGKYLALFVGCVPKMCLKQSHRNLLATDEGDRFFTLSAKGIVEYECQSADWPDELLQWVEEPEFPFRNKWPKTYMDVLAITADLWLPRSLYLDFPKQWFRHEKLRESIWNAVIQNDLDVSYNWLFLTPHIMKQWYQKNISAMLGIVEQDVYNPSAAVILNRIYKHVDIESLKIQKWCWKYHEKIALKGVLTHILQQGSSSMMNHISKQSVTSAAATLLTKKSVKYGLKHNYVAIFIRMLRRKHEQCKMPPNHHMKHIFKMIVSYIYSSLDAARMTTPLEESGHWVPMERPNPSHMGAFIQQRSVNGHIIKIEFHPTLKIHWIPLGSPLSLQLSNEEPIRIWKYYHSDGPNTMLECALTILSKDLWQADTRIKLFKWPTSEIDAFECENMSIRVFGEPMRIIKATYSQEGSKIHTSTGMVIEEEEEVSLSTVTPIWSYYEDQMYHIIPMKLKICSEVVKTKGHRSKVSVMYAKELIEAIHYKTINKEHRHRAPHTISAIVSQMDCFYVGLVTGEILEYESAANFVPIRHFVKHTLPILSMTVNETRLMTICEEEMNVWCLHTGCFLFGAVSHTQYISCMRNCEQTIWTVEKGNEHAYITLWNIFDETVLEHKNIPTTGPILTTEGPTLVTEHKVISLKKEQKEYELEDLNGNILCVTSTINGICGGTTEGIVFMVDEFSGDIQFWSTTTKAEITAVQAMDDQPYVITGTENGDIMIWNIDGKNTDIVAIQKITNARIDHIFFDNMFAAVIHNQHVHILSVVHERCTLAVAAIHKIMSWSVQWKRRLLKETKTLLKPCVETCILQESGVKDAISLLTECTEEYSDRLKWCEKDFIDVLLEAPRTITKLVIKRLASFSGPKVECVICNDEHRADRICYLKTCQHRFHTGCIAELIRKTPEYHHEMQQEYALHVTLKCPTCREPFVDSDVCDDRFLNQHFFHN